MSSTKNPSDASREREEIASSLVDRWVERLARAAIHGLRGRDPVRALAIGAAAGRAWVRFGAPRVREARCNLEIAFPDLAPPERERILRESFEHLGRSFAEVALLHGPHRQELLDAVRIEGTHHLERARELGEHGGVLVLTAHYGSWELSCAAMAERGYPITSVYRARRSSGLDHLIRQWREGSGQDVVALGRAGLGVLRALRRGRFVTMLLDQNARQDEGVFAPFFGVEACTRSGPAEIALRLGVPVVPVFTRRIGTGYEHVVCVHAPLALLAEPGVGDPMEAASFAAGEETERKLLRHNVGLMNAAIEQAIRADPAQWMWAHRRFRTRPAGARQLYPSRASRSLAWHWLRRVRRSLSGRGTSR